MTNRDNIIFYTITAVVFVGIIMFYTFGGRNEEEQSIAEKIAPYAAIISALAALIGAGAAVYVGTRKTRRDRVDDLKLEMQVLFTLGLAHEVIVDYTNCKFFDLLDDNFQNLEYKKLHQCVFDELRYEGRNEIVTIRKKYDDAMAQGIPIPMS